jgi:hypothetical protein
MARTACIVCLISTFNGYSKKRSLGRLALVVGTQQTLSNLFFSFDIYSPNVAGKNVALTLVVALKPNF